MTKRAEDSVVPHGSVLFQKIKDMRSFYGLSENGFRLYEKAGLCHPTRNEENNYRECSLSDAVLMCNAFDYTHYGFTLRQTAHILLESDLDGQIDELQGINNRYLEDLEDLIAKKRRAEDELLALREYVASPLSCRIVTGVDLRFMYIHLHDLSLGPGSADAAEWWDKAPLATAGLIVSLKEYNEEATEVWHGPVMREADAIRLQLPLGNSERFCDPARRYLHAFVKMGSEEVPTSATYAHAFGFLDEGHIAYDPRKIMHRLLRWLGEGEASYRLDEVFIPILP